MSAMSAARRGFWAVLCREIVERRLLLLAAVLVGLVPLAVPFLPGVNAPDPGEIRTGTALALCLVVTAVLALTLGATVIAGDLSERRLGFYFSRPLAGWAIWAGKLVGAAALCMGAGLLVLLPSLLLDPRVEIGPSWWLGDSWIRTLPAFFLFLAAGAAVLLLVAHVASTMVRSRSSWILLDLAATFAVAALVWSERQHLLRQGAYLASLRGLAGFLALLGASALVAGAVQVTRGRTDPRRGHRLLSLTFWAGMSLAALSFAAYAHWVMDVTPRDLVRVGSLLPAQSGTWIGLRGPVAGRGDYAPAFLFDTASGRSFQIGAPPISWWWLQPVFSPDGTRAAWLEAAGDGLDLKILDLTRPDARPAATRVSFDTWPSRLALAPGGTRLAALVRSSLTVTDVATGRLLSAVPFPEPEEEFFSMRFLPGGRLRIDERLRGAADFRMSRFTAMELGHGGLSLLGTIESPDVDAWTVSRDGERVAAHSRRLLRLFAVRTRELLAELPLQGELAGVSFLSDGRLLVDERWQGSAVLHLLDRDGVELRRFPFPQATRIVIGGEIAPNRLTLATRTLHSSLALKSWTAFLLDLDNGGTTLLGPGLAPAGRALGPESVGPRLFLAGERELALLDPATWRLRIVLRLSRD
jgi:hypothetical protein